MQIGYHARSPKRPHVVNNNDMMAETKFGHKRICMHVQADLIILLNLFCLILLRKYIDTERMAVVWLMCWVPVQILGIKATSLMATHYSKNELMIFLTSKIEFNHSGGIVAESQGTVNKFVYVGYFADYPKDELSEIGYFSCPSKTHIIFS